VTVRVDAGGYRANLRSLETAQKPARGTAAYSRLVNRPVARRVAAAVELVGMSPNGATAVSASLSAAGLLLLAVAEPSLLVGFAVALLLAAGYVMDSVDGQLARLTGRGSLAGEWLDHTVDCVKTASLHLAVLIAFYRFPPVEERIWLLVPVAFLVVDMVSFFGLVTMPLLRKLQVVHTSASQPLETTPEHPLRRWVLLPTDYGVFCWMFVLVGWPVGFLAGYTARFAVNTVVLMVVLRKWWAELQRLSS
jgi:phosphatidylglycerophosphate synthase